MKLISKLSLSILIFICSFIVYLQTAVPDVTFTDSGELAGACVTLGIAHPTGYPLFVILGNLWSHIPLGISKIYQLNIFAGVLTAVSAVVFFNVVALIFSSFFSENKPVKLQPVEKPHQKPHSKDKKAKKKPEFAIYLSKNSQLILAAITALIYAYSRTIWGEAVSIEVYSLHLLLINLVLFFILKASIDKNPTNNIYYIAAFALGLSFSNHLTTILLVPAIFFLFFKRFGDQFDFSRDRLKFLGFLLIALLIGVSFYLYLPLRSASLPEFNWGWVHRSFSKFMYHVQGKQYQVWMFSGTEAIAANLKKFFATLPFEFGIIGLVPLLTGFYAAYRLSKELFWFLLILIFSCLFYSLNYSIHDIETYFSLAFISLIIFTGIGLAWLLKFTPKLLPTFLIIPIISVVLNFNYNDESKNYLVPEFTKLVTENLQKNAIIISAQWDFWVSAFWYKQRVENYRPDIVLVEKELLRRTWYLEQFKFWYPEVAKLSGNEMAEYLKQLQLFESATDYDPVEIQARYVGLINSFIEKNIDKRPIYVTIDLIQSDDNPISKKFELVPEGFAFRLYRDKSVRTVSLDKMNVDKFVSSIKKTNDHLVQAIQVAAVVNFGNIANYSITTKNYDVALKALQQANKIDPENQNVQAGIIEVIKLKKKENIK